MSIIEKALDKLEDKDEPKRSRRQTRQAGEAPPETSGGVRRPFRLNGQAPRIRGFTGFGVDLLQERALLPGGNQLA